MKTAPATTQSRHKVRPMNTHQTLSAAATSPARSPSCLFLGWLLVFLSAWLLTGAAQATEVALAWDAVQDERVGMYELHYGHQSGQYEASRQITGTSVQLAQLEADTSYYFAVRACTADASLCSDFSDEVSARTPAPPAADFAASPTSGVAPLTVSFSDASAGDVDRLQWDFGDGASSTGSAPSHTYDSAGTYSVTLTAAGPGGEDSASKSGYIVVSEPPPVAAMSQSTDGGTAPVTVTFSDASTGAVDAWSWDLGDGTTATSGQVVHTYSDAGTYDVRLTVTGPGGSDSVLRTEAVVVEAPAVPPSAEFTADITTGKAPLTVRFADLSGGDVESWSWSFGDGGTSTAQNPTHTYDEPGRYAVTLTASGPAGSDSHTRSGYIAIAGDPSVEVGEALVDDRGLWIELDQVFTDPVVVAKITSANEADPVTVRVSDVSPEGFWLQLEEWEYLDGMHAEEAVSYLAVERGVHELPDGRWLEADLVDTGVTNGFAGAALYAPFTDAPVLLASVNTRNEADPVAVRLRNISATGFEIGLDEQEANGASHAVETIAFIAVEPGSGTLGDWRYEAGRTADTVTHRDHGLHYGTSFDAGTRLLLDMQSTDGPDTATLRARNVTAAGAAIWVEEEQSRESETNHTTETAGYLVLGQPRTGPTPTDELVFEAGEALVDDRGLWIELDQVFTDPVVVAKITSANEADPVTVRVSDVSPEGFWLQLEEWEYLDGMHAEEAVSYLAVERGVHELPDGRWLEAARIDTSVTNSLAGAPLFAPFGQTPVLLASVNTRNEADPVAVRLRNISATGFEIGLDEQEANGASHAVETIAFIAVEPGSGTLGDWRYEAGRTADTVTHRDHALSYSSGFATAPILFADMQSTDGPDTATLRARNVTAAGATIWVEEEQSRESEMNHTTETAGYLALE